MRLILTALLSMTLGGTALAQEATPGSGGMIYYAPGGNLLTPAPLNTAIQGSGYAPYGGLFAAQGGGILLAAQRVLIGGEYQGLFGQMSTSGQESLRLDGGYGLLHLGYLAWSSPTFQFYPVIGVGYGGATLRGSQTLNNLLSLSQGSNTDLRTVHSQSWLLDLGLGAQVTLPMSPDNAEDQRGPVIGLRGGWLLPLGSVQWSANELPVQGGPALTAGGPYLRLILGFGAFQ